MALFQKLITFAQRCQQESSACTLTCVEENKQVVAVRVKKPRLEIIGGSHFSAHGEKRENLFPPPIDWKVRFQVEQEQVIGSILEVDSNIVFKFETRDGAGRVMEETAKKPSTSISKLLQKPGSRARRDGWEYLGITDKFIKKFLTEEYKACQAPANVAVMDGISHNQFNDSEPIDFPEKDEVIDLSKNDDEIKIPMETIELPHQVTEMSFPQIRFPTNDPSQSSRAKNFDKFSIPIALINLDNQANMSYLQQAQEVNRNLKQIGQIGEKFVFEVVLKSFKDRLIWLNQRSESFKPYDGLILKQTFLTGNTSSTEVSDDQVEYYIEVKTSTVDKSFHLSTNEQEFANSKESRYVVILVVLSSTETELIVVGNPCEALSAKRLKVVSLHLRV